MATRPILIISGTNRPNSNALRVSRATLKAYESTQTPARILSLTDLPVEVFSPDAYATRPAALAGLQQDVYDAGGLHVVTPEYNGSYPGVLKYFIDMLKFPESFDHKPVAFTGQASGTWGGLRAVEQLQMVFAYRNAHLYPKRVFIAGVHGKFDAGGQLLDEDLKTRIADQCAGFAKFIASVSA